MKKKVLFLITTMSCGGAERALINAVKLLPREEYDFTVISVTKGDFYGDLPSFVEYKPIVKTKNLFFRKLAISSLYNLPIKNLFCKLFIRDHYDIAIAFLEGIPTNIASKLKNVSKKIAFVHFGITEDKLVSLGYKNHKQFVKSYSSFDKICFVSEASKKCFTSLMGEKNNYSVVHNFIDNEYILKKSKEKSEDIFTTKGVKFVSVGRLVKFKGHSRLIDIAKKLEDKFDFEIAIIGSGRDYNLLSEKIKRIGCKSVKLIGYKENPYTYMKQADLYISSSHGFEGYNTAVCEALILGLPVLTTNSNGMKEILCDGEYGLITDVDDKSLEVGFEKMLTDNLYLDYKERVSKFDKEFFIKNAIKEYSEILDC